MRRDLLTQLKTKSAGASGVLELRRDPVRPIPGQTVGLNIKAADLGNDGKFTGYLSTWDTEDWYGENFAKGAFTESLEELKASGALLPILWQHDMREPLGVWQKLEEDEKGLWGEGQILVKAGPTEKRAWEHIKAGTVNGLSVGYFLKEYINDMESDTFTITNVDLREASVVTFGANREALIDGTKAMVFEVRRALAAGKTLDQKQIEFALMADLGFTQKAARELVAGGYKNFLEAKAEGENDDDTTEALDLDPLPSFNLPSFE